MQDVEEARAALLAGVLYPEISIPEEGWSVWENVRY